MKFKIGQLTLISGVALFITGAIGYIVGFLPQNVIVAMGALALLFVGVGISMRHHFSR